jgi:hypothetical protein
MNDAIKLFCTDKNVYVEAHMLNLKKGVFLEAAVNTVKIKMSYKNNAYVGSMAGLEFVIKEDQLPKYTKEYQR